MSRFIRAAVLSVLLLVPIAASAATYPTFLQPQSSADIVGFNIENATAASQASRYVTWGQAFVQGKVASGASLTATVNGLQTPAQMDVKTRYPDGTVRFAVITVQAPALAPSAKVSGMLSLGGSAGTPVNLPSALANYNVSIGLSGGLSSTIDVKAKLLEALNNGTATYWLQGQNATQARVDVPISSSMHVVVDVTAYKDGTFLTDAQFRNDYSMQATGGTVNYTATISQNGSNVYTSPALTHYQYEVWRRVFHTNGAPTSDTHNIQRDVAHYIKAGVVPNYDLSTAIPDTQIGSVSSTNIVPLSDTGYMDDWGTTGDRDDIGPMPNWHAKWLRTQNAVAAKHALAMGNGAGSFPWHHYDPTTKDYISLDKYPTLWIDDANRGEVDLAQPIRDTKWRVEVSHPPAATMIPYVFTGDRYFLDGVNAQASAVVFMLWPLPRQNGKGIAISDAYEIRAGAWSLRSIDEAAWANPDGTATKAYWQRILDNNYTNWINNEMPALTASQGEVYGWYGGQGRDFPPSLGSWQHDYFANVMSWAVLRGNNPKALTVLNWMSNYIVGRATNAAKGMDPRKAAPYQLNLATSGGTYYNTWAQLGAANSVNAPTDENYPAIYTAALASVYNATGNPKALEGYNTFTALNLFNSAASHYVSDQAKFRIIPTSGVVVTPPPPSTPTVTLSANPTSIATGGSATLTWSSTNATSCTGTGFTASGTSGSATVSPANTTTYSINCSGTGGSASASATVTVSTVTPPSTKFIIGDRVQVTGGTLNVRSTPSTSGTLLGSQAVGVLGTVVGGPTNANTYNWWSINYDSGVDGWSVEDNLVKSTATPPPPPPGAPTVTLSASPTSVTAGGSATLTWSSTNATSCTGSNGWTGTKAVTGTQAVTPTATATYTLTCTGAGGTATANATVTVSTVTPPATGNVIQVGPTRTYKTPSAAKAVAQDGYTIQIDAGTYTDDFVVWTQNNLTLQGVGGKAKLVQSPGATISNGKGIWVIQGNNNVVDNIEFTGAIVPDNNGVGIRIEGTGITIKNSYFHDNQGGILASDNANSDIVITNSEFARNGNTPASAANMHNLYINHVRSLTFTNNYSHSGLIGHLLKSRAYKNVIAYNRLTDESDATASYEIDIPNGGETYIIGNLIEQTQNSQNPNIIAYNAEGVSGLNGGPNPIQKLYIVNNTIVNNRSSGTFIWVSGTPSDLKIENNIFAGPGTPVSGAALGSGNVITTSPGFVNAGGFDYRLTASSPAIDKGIAQGTATAATMQYLHPLSSQTRTTSGIAIDAGAYEYSGTITPPPTATPTVTLTASPTSITSGQSSTLTWSSTNATSCAGTGFTASGTSGSATVSPTATASYSMSCTGAGGTATANASVTVSTVTPPSTKFIIGDRVQVTGGTLNVRSSASTAGTLLGSQAVGMLGTVVGGPTAANTYNWWNINYDSGVDGWSVEDNLVKSTTTPPPPPPSTPTVTLSANPTAITAGSSATLTWSSTSATSCTASGGWTGTKATSGTQSVTPTATASYSLTCTGAGGSASANASVTVGTTPPPPPPTAGGTIVGFNLQNTSASAQAARYVTFGQPFVQGAVSPSVSLVATIGGQTSQAQMDVKTTHPDGSVRFAVITVLAPALAASQTVSGSLSAGGSAGSPIDLATALAGYNATVSLTGGITQTINATQQMLSALSSGKATYWLRGPLATQARVDVPVTSSFHIIFDITAYADGTFSTDAQFNNDYAMQPTGGTQRYTASIAQNGTVAYTSPSLTHYQYQQWRKVVYSNGAPNINVQRDVAYLLKTKVFPNYDLSPVNPSAIETKTYAPLVNPGYEPGMGTAGDRSDIGLTTQWNAIWLISQDARAMQTALAMADGAGTIPWHYFDPATGDYLSLDKYPTLWADDRGTPKLTQNSQEPNFSIETPHHPDPSFVPYVLTGQRHYLDRINAVATHAVFATWNFQRQDGKGLMINNMHEIRGQAWSLRDINEAAWANPDGSTAKAYWKRIQDNNYNHFVNVLIPQLSVTQGEVQGYLGSDYGYNSVPPTTAAPWQQDYLMSVVAQGVSLGHPTARTALDWIAKWSIGRVSNPSVMDPRIGINYNFTQHKTWAETGSKNTFDSSAGNYAALGLNALATLYNITGDPKALAGYNTLLTAKPDYTSPTWMRGDYIRFSVIPVGGTVTPPPPNPVPTVTLSANPTSITTGATSTLIWSSTNATSCTASGGWTGTKATSGTQSVSPTASATYSLTCTGAGGTATANASVSVSTTPPPPPTSTKFLIGDRVQVFGSSVNVRSTPSTAASSLGTQSVGVLGTVIGGPTSANAFNWWNINYDSGADGWSVEDYLVKSATTPPPPTPAPTVSLSVSPASITAGASATLTWSSTNATSCTASGSWSGAKTTSGTQSVSPAASATYSLTCTGAGGTATANASVTVGTTPPPTPAPTITLTASPTSITSGQSSTLTWSSTNATSCTGTGFTASGTSGSATVSPTATASYSMSCTGTGGTATANVGVTVGTTPPPTTGIQVGDRVKLTTNTNVRGTPNGTILGTQQLDRQGTVVGGPNTAGGYSWWQVDFDTGLDGWVASLYVVEIAGTLPPPPTPAPTITLTASPTSITSGQSSTLTWSSTNATSCTGTGFTASGTSGSATVSPTATASYSMSCTGAGGTATANVGVGVTSVPLPPPPTGGTTLGNTSTGTVTDSNNSNTLEVTKFTSGSQGGAAQSMSIYVASPVSSAPNNKFSLAIYGDAGGAPGALIAQSAVGTLVGDAWNTLPITATIAPNTTYWLGYTTNGTSASHNNFRLSSGSASQIRWKAQAFGTWPSNFGPTEGGDAYTATIYVTFTPGTTTPPPTPSTPTVTLTASPTSITSGQSSTLTWSSTNATSCTGTGFTASGTSGSATVSPTATASYSMSCTGAGGTATANVGVTVAAPVPETLTLGKTGSGGSADSNNSNYINAIRFRSGAKGGAAQSISVYVANPIGSAPNNQFSVALYANNAGTPGALIAQAGTGTLTGNAWNTLPISATIAPDTVYWLAYNTNGTAADQNNIKVGSGSNNQMRWISQTFGSWPTNFGTPEGSSAYNASIYLTYTTGEVTGPKALRINNTLAKSWTGPEVSFLQSVLKKLGFFNGEMTGYFGNQTAAAVSAFQRASGLEPVGIVGPKTRALLNGQ